MMLVLKPTFLLLCFHTSPVVCFCTAINVSVRLQYVLSLSLIDIPIIIALIRSHESMCAGASIMDRTPDYNVDGLNFTRAALAHAQIGTKFTSYAYPGYLVIGTKADKYEYQNLWNAQEPCSPCSPCSHAQLRYSFPLKQISLSYLTYTLSGRRNLVLLLKVKVVVVDPERRMSNVKKSTLFYCDQ